jgi:hypothetical protein
MGMPSSENDNALEAFDTLGSFLEEDGWHPQRIEEQYIYRTGFEGQNGRMPCIAQIVVELEVFQFYAYASVKVPEENRLAAAEFLTRANYGMRIGNFELDFRDGEVRYKSSLDFEDSPLTPTMIRNAIYPAVQTIDRYLPGLMEVIYAGVSPEDAVAKIEG